jgi:ABC-type Fe3+ transport system permease subunit
MNAKNTCALFLGVIFLLLFIVIVIPHFTAWPVAPEALKAGEALWKGRTYEVILQGFIMLSGVMAILLLLGLNHSRRQRQ